ncbi:MAG: DUF554 domain-containing protein [Euryarchaeota archaeon]|nr:DUF554 domain-containing protein [Euryarchaeota archaeon]
MLGTIVNSLAIVAASLLGVIIGRRFSDRMRETVMQALGLAVLLVGLEMSLSTQNPLIIIASLVAGSVVGEAVDIEGALARAGRRLEEGTGRGVAKAFVSATLIFCVGSMAIVGAIQDGLRGDATLLYTKAMLDGVVALAFASVMGIGVALSAVSVLVYQGTITLLAGQLGGFLVDRAVVELEATGGLLVMGIGINILGIGELRVGNMLPALVLAPVLATLAG